MTFYELLYREMASEKCPKSQLAESVGGEVREEKRQALEDEG